MNRGFKIFTGAALGLCRQALQLLAGSEGISVTGKQNR